MFETGCPTSEQFLSGACSCSSSSAGIVPAIVGPKLSSDSQSSSMSCDDLGTNVAFTSTASLDLSEFAWFTSSSSSDDGVPTNVAPTSALCSFAGLSGTQVRSSPSASLSGVSRDEFNLSVMNVAFNFNNQHAMYFEKSI